MTFMTMIILLKDEIGKYEQKQVKVRSQGRCWRGAAAWQREHAGRGGAPAVGHDRHRLQAEASPGPELLCVTAVTACPGCSRTPATPPQKMFASG